MSKSEFRWNKKRKHYSYIFKDYGIVYLNILITSKQFMVEKKNKRKVRIIKNICLLHHPNPNKEGVFYVIPKIYFDKHDSFDIKVYPWSWNYNDKRKIKRIKKSATTPVKVNHRLK